MQTRGGWTQLSRNLLNVIQVSPLTTALLPETAGIELPDTVAEAEQFGIGQEFFYLPGLKKKRDQGTDDVAVKA